MKNNPFDMNPFQLGSTVIGVGFVDNSELLFSPPSGDSTEPMKFIGIDSNPICVARAMLIYEMMK